MIQNHDYLPTHAFCVPLTDDVPADADPSTCKSTTPILGPKTERKPSPDNASSVHPDEFQWMNLL